MANIVGPHAALMKNSTLLVISPKALSDLEHTSRCPKCSRSFTPELDANQKYCSAACSRRGERWILKYQEKCADCDRVFFKKTESAKYCSHQCADHARIYRHKRAIDENTCTRFSRQKIVFPDLYRAFAVIDDLKDKTLNAYICECGGIHIGHPSEEGSSREALVRPSNFLFWEFKIELKTWGRNFIMVCDRLGWGF